MRAWAEFLTLKLQNYDGGGSSDSAFKTETSEALRSSSRMRAQRVTHSSQMYDLFGMWLGLEISLVLRFPQKEHCRDAPSSSRRGSLIATNLRISNARSASC